MEVIELWTALHQVVEVRLEVTGGQHRVGQTCQVNADNGKGISEIHKMHTHSYDVVNSSIYHCIPWYC